MKVFAKQPIIETRKNSLITMAEHELCDRSAKGKSVWKDGVNHRADKNLETVLNKFETVLGKENISRLNEGELLQRNIIIDKLDFIDNLKMYYYSKNTLFARVYDLILGTDVQNLESGIDEDMDICVRFKGRMKISDAEFISADDSARSKEFSGYLNSIDLIRQKLIELEVIDFRLKYDGCRKKWSINTGMGKGSTVWSLLPPVMMLVQFTENDAMRVIELYKLVICAIAVFEKI